VVYFSHFILRLEIPLLALRAQENYIYIYIYMCVCVCVCVCVSVRTGGERNSLLLYRMLLYVHNSIAELR
jgi:streptolysin S family bacteriocin protoxin